MTSITHRAMRWFYVTHSSILRDKFAFGESANVICLNSVLSERLQNPDAAAGTSAVAWLCSFSALTLLGYA
jgi:hypothetical protein